MSRTARLMAHVWTKSWSCLRRLASNGPTVGQCSRGSCTSSSMRHINVWNPHWNRYKIYLVNGLNIIMAAITGVDYGVT